MNEFARARVAETEVELLIDGRGYQQAFIKLLKSAKKRVVLHTYIFEFDDFGKAVFTEILAASQRGAKVSLVVDAFGTDSPRKDYLKKIKESGIEYQEFNKIRWNAIHRWGRRLHHKVLVVDGIKSIVGGINVVSPLDEKYTSPRLDFAFYLEGGISQPIEKYCNEVLKKGEGGRSELTQSGAQHQEYVKCSVNDWVYGRKNIVKHYSEILRTAQEEVIIINSYFFPRKAFLKKLARAASRGVRVKLVLPKVSDWQSHVWASEYLYTYLLKHKVEVYQWSDSVLHGKMALIDSKYVILGSFNLHYTSFQGNLEMNVDIMSDDLANQVGKTINSLVLEKSQKVDPDAFGDQASTGLRLRRFSYYVIISTVSNFLLGFIHQEELDKEEHMSKSASILRISAAFFLFIVGVLGLVLPVIPGLVLIVLSLVIIYPVIIKNYKNI